MNSQRDIGREWRDALRRSYFRGFVPTKAVNADREFREFVIREYSARCPGDVNESAFLLFAAAALVSGFKQASLDVNAGPLRRGKPFSVIRDALQLLPIPAELDRDHDASQIDRWLRDNFERIEWVESEGRYLLADWA